MSSSTKRSSAAEANCTYRSKTMDERIHPVVPYGRHEFINFIERMLVSICIVLVAGVLLERHGIGLRDIVLSWLFIQLSWKGTVDDVLFKFWNILAMKISANEEKESK